jgi:tetratricopeptide (TPR) repeat protein
MFNRLEVIKVNSRQRPIFAIGLAAALVALGMPFGNKADAQRNTRSANQEAPRLLVVNFRSDEANLGVQAADALRDRIPRDIRPQELWVLSKQDLVGNLESSGYSPTEPLNSNDARLLARMLGADEYVEGRASRGGTGIRVEATMVSTQDNRIVQPLPPAEGRRVDHAMTEVSRHLRDARRQLPAFKECQQHVRDRNFQEAIGAANRSIEAYPQSVFGRICLASAYEQLEFAPDSMLRVANEILAIHPRNRHALAFASRAERAKGNIEVANNLLTTLLSTDPLNVQLQTQVINTLAESRSFGQAREIVREAIEQNPGEPDFIRLNFVILMAVQEWKEAIGAGEELVKADTAAADVEFFRRLATAYKNDSQPQRAAEAAARGISKFPAEASLYFLHSQLLREAGQLPQAVEAARRGLAIESNPVAFQLIAQTYLDMQQPDSAVSAYTSALVTATAEDSAQIGQLALGQGQRLFNEANAREEKVRAEFEAALPFLLLAEQVNPQPSSKFLLGVSNFYVAATVANELQTAPSCDLARKGQQAAGDAQRYTVGGGQFNPDGARQIMTGLTGQIRPYLDAQVTALCR